MKPMGIAGGVALLALALLHLGGIAAEKLLPLTLEACGKDTPWSGSTGALSLAFGAPLCIAAAALLWSGAARKAWIPAGLAAAGSVWLGGAIGAISLPSGGGPSFCVAMQNAALMIGTTLMVGALVGWSMKVLSPPLRGRWQWLPQALMVILCLYATAHYASIAIYIVRPDAMVDSGVIAAVSAIALGFRSVLIPMFGGVAASVLCRSEGIEPPPAKMIALLTCTLCGLLGFSSLPTDGREWLVVIGAAMAGCAGWWMNRGPLGRRRDQLRPDPVP